MSTSTSRKEEVPAHIEGQEQIEASLGELVRPLRHLPLERVKVRGNPRESAPETALEALTASTRRMGVLQSVLVRDCGDGDYELIAGSRRYEASRRAGRPTIPAMVIEAGEEIDEPTQLAMAIVENTLHVHLTPLEEAKSIGALIFSFGFTVDGAAELLSMNVELAKERLGLLELPPAVRARIASKDLTLRNAATLAPIAAKAPQVAEALAERVASGAQTGRALDEDPAAALRRLADEETQPPGTFLVPFGAHDSVNLDEITRRVRAAAAEELVPERASKGVEAALKEIGEALAEIPSELRVAEVRQEDADRARAFDVLLEYREGAHRRSGVLIDPVFAADWAREAAKMLGEAAPVSGTATGREAEMPDDREDPVKARERRKAEQLAARSANGHLDRELSHRFDYQEEVSLEQAQVIAALMVEAYGRDLAGGHRVVREGWLKRDVRPSRGGTRTVEEYPSIDEAPQLLEEELRRATTGPALIGRLFEAVASAVLCDQTVLGSSARPNLELPYVLGREEQLQGLAPAALWREAEGCLDERRAAELRHEFVTEADERSEPRRDRLARSEDVGAEVLELAPEGSPEPAAEDAAGAEDGESVKSAEERTA